MPLLSEMKQITGRELLAKLQELPDALLDLPVFTWGCDCIGEACQPLPKGNDGNCGPGLYIDRRD